MILQYLLKFPLKYARRIAKAFEALDREQLLKLATDASASRAVESLVTRAEYVHW